MTAFYEAIKDANVRGSYLAAIRNRGKDVLIKDLESAIELMIEALGENQKLVAENARMREIIDAVTDLDNEPQYHEIGMGCGLEDRGITDRYEAMRHGWDAAMERVYGEVIPCDEELEFKATDAAIAEIEAKSIEGFVSKLAYGLRTAGGGDGYHSNPYHECADHIELKGIDYVEALRAGDNP